MALKSHQPPPMIAMARKQRIAINGVMTPPEDWGEASNGWVRDRVKESHNPFHRSTSTSRYLSPTIGQMNKQQRTVQTHRSVEQAPMSHPSAQSLSVAIGSCCISRMFRNRRLRCPADFHEVTAAKKIDEAVHSAALASANSDLMKSKAVTLPSVSSIIRRKNRF